jgi:hypothetical protein
VDFHCTPQTRSTTVIIDNMDSAGSNQARESIVTENEEKEGPSSGPRLVKIIYETECGLFICEQSPGGKTTLSLEEVWAFGNGNKLLSRFYGNSGEDFPQPRVQDSKKRKFTCKPTSGLLCRSACDTSSDAKLKDVIVALTAERDKALQERDLANQLAREAKIERDAVQSVFTSSLGSVLQRVNPERSTPADTGPISTSETTLIFFFIFSILV